MEKRFHRDMSTMYRIKYVFRYINNSYLDIILILILGSLAILWFKGNYIITSGDFGLPLDREKYFYLTLFIWDETVGTGSPASQQLIALLPYSLYAIITDKLGLSIYFFEKSIFYFLFAFSGINMYFLSFTLGIKRLGRLTSSMLYMMNPISMAITWKIGIGMMQPPYVFAPLFLGLFIYGLNNRKKIDYIMLCGLISLVFITWAFEWVVVVALYGLPILLYCIYYIILNNGIKKYVIVYAVQFFAIFVLLNIFWIIPTFVSLSSIYHSASSSSLGYISNIETLKLNSVQLLGSLRLIGLWSVNGEFLGDPFYLWGRIYSTRIFAILTFIYPILAVVPLFAKNREMRSLSIYLWALILVSLFFAKGPFPPFGGIYSQLFENYSWIALAFRMGFIAFSIPIALGFCPLVGIGVHQIYDLIKPISIKLSSFAVLSAYLILFCILSYPFLTGEVINAGGNYLPSERIVIPEYYSQANIWLSGQDGDFRIFSLPMSRNYNSFYNWSNVGDRNGYNGIDIMKWYSPHNVINSNSNALITLIGEQMGNDNFGIYSTNLTTPLWIKANMTNEKIFPKNSIRLLNTKYILMHYDFNWEIIKGYTWYFQQDLGDLDLAISELRNASKIGGLGFFELNEGEYIPLIYASYPRIVYDMNKFIDLAEGKDFNIGKECIIVTRQNPHQDVTEIKDFQKPNIYFQKINSIKYNVLIKNATGPFYLIFSETYNPEWKAYVNSDRMIECKPLLSHNALNVTECKSNFSYFEINDVYRIFGKSISEENHFMANGYANAWYIDPNQLNSGATFTITIYFKNQIYATLGLIISIIIATLIVLYLIYTKFRKPNTEINGTTYCE